MKKAFLLLVAFVFAVSGVWGQESIIEKVKDNSNMSTIKWDDTTYVIHCSSFNITKPLTEIVAEHPVIENKTYPFAEYPDKKGRPIQTFEFSVEKDGAKYGNDSSIIQNWIGTNSSKAPIQNWAGQTATGFRPDDPTGAVSPDHYIQMINSTTYRIYNKTGSTLLTGTFGNLWSPATGNAGDPIILYDRAAGRWFMSQFDEGTAPYSIYIAISTTSDPLGTWYTYTFTSPDFPDYLKFSAWQDGYYMTANFGQKIFAFNRAKMLAGIPTAEAVYKTFTPPQSGFFVPLPADASDGTMPGAGTPCPIFSYSDDGWGGGNIDAINIYNAAVNWSGTPSMTVTSAGVLPTSAFDGSYNSLWNDISQPGSSQKLDGIGGAMMFRAQWKTWTGYNTVVLNWAVRISATQRGIFWCELRQNQGTGVWSIYQQGIYAPGTDSYWMGSIAMNDAGGIALAYAKGSTSTYMSLGYVGRLSCDPLGTFPISEVIAQAGLSSQEGTNRVGDYAHTCLDPDGMTFWHTGEYMASGGAEGTRIYSFQLPGGCNPPTISNVSPTTLFEDRGKQITITGTDLLGCTFIIGGVSGSVFSNNGTTAVIDFPAGNYSNGTLTVSNGVGNDTESLTVSRRNTIPVVAGALATSDNHPTVESAVDGLYAWYGTTAFNAGETPGTKTIDVDAGTYAIGASLTAGLNPTAANPLIIQNQANDVVIIDATGDTYGFDLSTVDYVQLKGFTVYGASLANINILGDNNTIEYNKCYSSVSGSGLKLGAGNNNQINNNLMYSNIYGIHIQTSTNSIIKNNTIYDNGGLLPGVSTTIHSQGFNTASVPTGWSTEVLNDPGTNPTITFVTSGTRPTISAIPEGARFIEFNSYNCPEAASIRIKQTASFSTTGYTNIQVNFTWYEDTQYPTDPDGVTIQWSTNGSTWNDATTYSRVGSTNGWFDKVCTLPVGAENQANLYISLKFTSSYGNNCHLDNLIVKGTPSTNSGAAIYVESGSGSSIQNNIFYAKSGNNNFYALQSATGITVSSSYNTYYTTNTNLFNYNGTIGNTGPIGTGDITTDPQFVNAPTDFHIKSQAGSYKGGAWPPTIASGGAWSNDASTSPAVDAGDPSDLYGNEPEDNGNRVNQGTYGNTFQASKTYAVVCSYPSTQASVFGATPSTNSINVSWTRGNGNAVLVVARQGGAVNADPSDGVNYADNAAFGLGDEIGTGNFVVYDGALTSINVTGLSSSTTYYFAIYEYNSTGYCYLVPELTGNSTTTAPPTFTWTGVTSTNWQTTTNWSSGVVPTASDNVTIPLGCSNYPVINNGIGTPALCNNLTISGGSVTIAPDGYMTVAGSITNSVGVTGLIIQSTDAGTGSLIQNSSTDVNATVQCRLSSTTRQWHMVSSPITTAPFTVFPSQNSLYYYNEGTADYWTGTVYDAGSISGWTAPAGNMVVGKGYSFNYFASSLSYTGILNNNTSTSAIAVPYTNHDVIAPNGANYDNFDGWNLIGNPYTSAIDWDDLSVLHGAANLLDAVYTYDDETLHNYTSYVGGVGTNGGTRYIPAMQGFFVKGAATELGGSLNIGANARVHNAQSYWKGYNETPENFIRLEVNGNGYKDETVVRMLNAASEDLDNGMDAYKFFTMHGSVPQIYTRTNSDVDYSINTVSVLEEGSMSIPIRLMQTGDAYTIRVSEFNFTDIKVYLKDNYNSKTMEIGLEDVIELTANESDASDRFELVFEKAGSSSVVIADQVKAVIYPNPNSGSFYVTVTNGKNGYEMEISNITGQLIYKNKFSDHYTKEIKLNVPNAGVYFVKFRFNDNSTLNKKIIVND